MVIPEGPRNLIGDNAYDSDKLNEELSRYGIELIARYGDIVTDEMSVASGKVANLALNGRCERSLIDKCRKRVGSNPYEYCKQRENPFKGRTCVYEVLQRPLQAPLPLCSLRASESREREVRAVHDLPEEGP